MTTETKPSLADRALQALEEQDAEAQKIHAEQTRHEIESVKRHAMDKFSKALGSILYGEQIGPDVWEVASTWSPEEENVEAYATIGGLRFMYEVREDYYTTLQTIYLMDTCPRCSIEAAKAVPIENEADLGRALKSDTFRKHRVVGSETESGWTTFCDGQNQYSQRGETTKPEPIPFEADEAEQNLLLALRKIVEQYVESMGS